MTWLAAWEDLPRDGRPRYAAIGTFDGVHRGHKALVSHMAADARRDGAVAVAATFEPHPLAVLAPERAPALLTSLPERVELLRQAGAEYVVVRPFTPLFAALEAEAYVREELARRAGLARAYVGFNFTFGRGGRAGAAELASLGREVGLAVVVEPPAGEDGLVWSSTFARQALAAGDLEAAARCLGRPYAVRGPVVRGDGRGRELGFPTANVSVPAWRAMPPPGVYAAEAGPPGGPVFPAAVSWGRRPTFGGGALRLEAHLVGFSGELYGRELEVRFHAWIREERRFERAEELVREMRRDVEAVLARLGRTRL